MRPEEALAPGKAARPEPAARRGPSQDGNRWGSVARWRAGRWRHRSARPRVAKVETRREAGSRRRSGPSPTRGPRSLGASEPEGLTEAERFGGRRAEGLSGSAFPGRFFGSVCRMNAANRASKTRLRRERIVDAAMRHFAEHGYRGARVEDIAA